jgi:hypothetical protein
MLDRRYWRAMPSPQSGIARIVLDAIATRTNRSAVGLFVVGDCYRLVRKGETAHDDPALAPYHVGDFSARTTRDDVLNAFAKFRAGLSEKHKTAASVVGKVSAM